MEEKDVRKIISQNICGLRKREKMTQADLAEKLYYSDKAISKWERGESLPDAEMLYQISQLFHVDIQYLFTEHEDMGLTLDEQRRMQKKENGYRCLFVLSIFIIIFTLCLTILTSFMKELEVSRLKMLLFFIPLLPAVLLTINLVFGRKRLNLVFASLIIWTLAEAFYVYFYRFNLMYIFAVAIVLDVAILVWPRFNQFLKNRNNKNKKK